MLQDVNRWALFCGMWNHVLWKMFVDVLECTAPSSRLKNDPSNKQESDLMLLKVSFYCTLRVHRYNTFALVLKGLLLLSVLFRLPYLMHVRWQHAVPEKKIVFQNALWAHSFSHLKWCLQLSSVIPWMYRDNLLLISLPLNTANCQCTAKWLCWVVSRQQSWC
jgi:hypothetical protein